MEGTETAVRRARGVALNEEMSNTAGVDLKEFAREVRDVPWSDPKVEAEAEFQKGKFRKKLIVEGVKSVSSCATGSKPGDPPGDFLFVFLMALVLRKCREILLM